MTILRFEVTVYQVCLVAGYDTYSQPQGGTPYTTCGRITCTGEQGETLAIFLVADGSAVPENWFDPEQQWGRIFVPAPRYAWFLDILRNEGPVYAYMNTDLPQADGLITGAEPVGIDDEGY